MPATTPRERGARRVRTKAPQRRPSGGGGSFAASHAEPAPAFNAGINPLYGSGMSPEAGAEAARIRSATAAAAARETSAASSSSQPQQQQSRPAAAARAARTRTSSPQSTRTASTTQSTGSARLSSRPQGVAAAPPPPAKATMTAGSSGGAKKQPQEARSAPASRNGSINKGSSGNGNSSKGDFVPAPLVPALLAPVPPPPAKRRAAADIEAGEEVGEVLEDAPDKTLMEMLQTYLKKQDLYTRMVLVVVLLVLAGGVLGAYVVMLWFAIDEKQVKYIVLVSFFTVALLWVLWRYCFSGDEKLQDQSQIAQDIATLYAAIPDHTAVKGVSEKGRAQFTDFKYEKSEMMFTAVTDDGVSLGSERGSELMMDGADPSCPLCNKAYVEGAELCLLPCLHVFHKTCIHKWCNRHIVCPLCKRHLEAAEPLHTLTAAYNHPGGNAVQSEPGHRGFGNAQPRHQWRGVLGNAPGPASAHGSERGLGGTRSEDGMWNDRVLNAAQQQQMGGKHNRVTSFSSETRRSNNARGRPGERAGSGRGSGPPQSSSAGAGMGPQRAQSVSGSTGWQQQQQNHRLQRKRSSSFTTATEQRGRGGSGRVAHGTARHRSSAGSLARGDLSTSPRSRSDLGVGSRDAEHMRASSDAMLSRHASRRNNGAGGTKALTTKPMFHEDTGGAEAWDADGGGGAEEVKGEPGRRMATMASAPGRSGLHSSRQGPAVITVHKVQQNTRSGSGGRRRPRRESGGGRRESARWSGGESESDVGGGGERVFNSRRMPHEDDSPDDEEVTTKALTYAPRKSRATAKDKKDPGHRRQSSTGSTSGAEEFGFGGGGGSSKKSRRRPSIPGSKSGSGNQSAIATAAATAEAVSKLLGRSTPEDRSSSSAAAANAGVRRSSITSDGYSDGDSGSDVRVSTRRNSRGSSSSVRGGGGKRGIHPQPPQQQPPQQQSQQQQQQQQPQQVQQLKNTPTKTGPVTKGTPAPPMAAARVATWNSTSSALAPTVDVSQSLSMSETELPGPGSNAAAAAAVAAGAPGGAEAAASEAGGGVGSSPSAEIKGTGGGRGWSLKIPSSLGSAEFFGLGSSAPGTRKNSADTASGPEAAAAAAGAEGESDRERDGSSSRSSSLRARVLSGRKSGSGKVGASTGRIFGSSSAAARVGRPPGNSTSGEAGASGVESAGEHAGGGRIGALRTSNSVQALIQTYEKKDRSSSDEKAPTAQREEWPLPAPTTSSSEGKRRLSNSKTFGSRRRGLGSTAKDEQAATESELDEEYVDRPKLSYKKKSSRSSIARSVFATADGPLTQNAMHAVEFRSVGGGRGGGGGKAGETDGDSEGGGEDDDEPYERPKLSYGGGLRSGSR